MYRGMFATSAFNKILLGDRYTNAVYFLDTDYFENDNHDGNGTNLIQRIFTTPVEYATDKNITVRELQLNMQQGLALQINNSNGVGRNPVVEMFISRDAGHTFGNGQFASIGGIGQFAFRTRWTKLGIGRNLVYKFRITTPILIVVLGIALDYEVLKR